MKREGNAIIVEVAEGRYQNRWTWSDINVDPNICRDSQESYRCTREVGHEGVHVAHAWRMGSAPTTMESQIVCLAWIYDVDMMLDAGL